MSESWMGECPGFAAKGMELSGEVKAGMAEVRGGGCLGAAPALLPVERAVLARMGDAAACMEN